MRLFQIEDEYGNWATWADLYVGEEAVSKSRYFYHDTLSPGAVEAFSDMVDGSIPERQYGGDRFLVLND